MRKAEYEEKEEQLYRQAIKTETPLKEGFFSFKDFIGQYSPDEKMIQNLLEYALYSDLNSTGINGFKQYTCEIQGQISILLSASNHTWWAAVKNYSKKDIDNAQTIFAITTETGEIACAVIVQSISASQFSHTLGQFLNCKGCNSKMYVTDNSTGLLMKDCQSFYSTKIYQQN